MNTLTDINAHLFPITDGGNTYHDMAAYAYRAAVGCSDKHARSALARLATVGLAARIGTQWEALPVSLDALEALEGGAR